LSSENFSTLPRFSKTKTHGSELVAIKITHIGCIEVRDVLQSDANSIKSPVIRRVLKLLHDSCDESVNPKEIARRIGISVRQLEKAFRRHLDQSPAKFPKQARLKKGRHMICHTSMRIIDIAMTCGFNDSSHFTRAYKDAFCCTPSEDRID
jgi:transcriptional regulator GlxA family with amidase domain